MAKRRSFGSAFLGFLRGLISFALILILVAAVGINVIFSSDDSAPKIDIPNFRYTFFVNTTSNLKNIDENSFCFIDHTRTPEENTYVLCNAGKGNQILCLESITENENGSLSYNVKADRMEILDTVYSLPATKIYGTVFNKDDVLGEVIVFARSIKGSAVMFGAAFLLILLSISAIKSKRTRYDDALQDAELAMEEQRKKQRSEEKKAEEHRKAMAEKAAKEAENALAAKVEAAVREAEAATAVPAEPEKAPAEEQIQLQTQKNMPVSDPDPAPFAFEEYRKRPEPAAEPAAPVQTQIPTPAPAPVPAVTPAPVPPSAPAPAPVPVQNIPAEPKNVNKYEFADFADEKPAEQAAAPVPEKREEKPSFQEVPLSVRPSYRYENLIQNLTESAEIRHSEETPAPAPAPSPVLKSEPVPAPASEVPQPAPAAPVKKKTKLPVKKLDAESIDDLIRILEEEKKKLD